MLQEFELVPVTDPGELATLDRRCRAAGKEKGSEPLLADCAFARTGHRVKQ